ncbi:MAG: hypothetical protein ACREQA_00410 [Candidatus Binatia bacterium]
MAATKDLRYFLDLLRKNGELLSIREEVDPRFEVCEFLRQFDKGDGPALLFEKVKGPSIRIVGNLVGTRRRLALAFGLQSEERLLETLPTVPMPLRERFRRISVPSEVREKVAKMIQRLKEKSGSGYRKAD